MNIPFSPPFIDESVEKEVLEALRSGWITTGPKVKALEEEVQRYTGFHSCVCVNSWTSGAIMMLRWFGIGEGDEVIVPSYTYAATAMAVLHAGAKPVMVDTAEDFNLDADKLKAAITSKTKAIILVDIGGWPANYPQVMKLVEESKSDFVPTTKEQKMLGRMLVISDAAHSFGATFNGSHTNPDADLVIYSFHAVKNLTTAEGGAICFTLPEPFNNDELKVELKRYSLNCQSKDAFTKMQGGSWKYDITGLGFKYNMPDICAAIGLAQIREYGDILNRRRDIFKRYNAFFEQHNWAQLPKVLDQTRESSYHLYMLRINGFNEDQRDRIIQLLAERGIAANVHFIPMPMLTLFKNLGYRIEDHPITYKNYASEISLPIYPQLTDDQVDYISQSVSECVNAVITGGQNMA